MRVQYFVCMSTYMYMLSGISFIFCYVLLVSIHACVQYFVCMSAYMYMLSGILFILCCVLLFNESNITFYTL
jgi:hypothetical protein